MIGVFQNSPIACKMKFQTENWHSDAIFKELFSNCSYHILKSLKPPEASGEGMSSKQSLLRFENISAVSIVKNG